MSQIAQHQNTQPGKEYEMKPRPVSEDPRQHGSFKLKKKIAVITGGDSGIGKAVALAFAKEGADSAILYLNEHQDAQDTSARVGDLGQKTLNFPGDIGQESFCVETVKKIMSEWGQIDILVNNAAEQHPQENFENISEEQLVRTFRTNIFSYFFMTKAILPHLKPGSTIINTTSVTAYRGSDHLVDYSSTKGAIVSFTRSLAKNLAKKGIRVNGVAPGPVWTPLIPSTFSENVVENFGSDVLLGRAGQPEEIAPSYVFLASDDSSYMTGQILHPNGGEIING